MPRHIAHPRHPLTGKQFRVSARSAADLARLLEQIDRLRGELRVGMVSEADVDRKLRRVRYGAVQLGKVLESYARRKDLSPDTIRAARTALRGPLRELADRGLDELEAPVLAPIFERLGATHAKSSITTTWRVLRQLLRHAAERGWIARTPWGAWRPRARGGKPSKPLREACRDNGERAALITAAVALDLDDVAGGRVYRALGAKIATAAFLGLRQGELAGLRTYDLYRARGVVGVRRQWDGDPIKGGVRGAELEAPPRLFELLDEHLERTGALRPRPASAPGAPIFEAPGGGPYLRGSKPIALEALRDVVRRAGLPNPERWTAHSLRDSFVTIVAQAFPGDLEAIRHRSRHTTIESLVRYLRSFQREALLPPPELARLPK
jgi:integrase